MSETANGYRLKLVEGTEKPFYVEGIPSLMTQEPSITRLMSHVLNELEEADLEMKKAFYNMIARGLGFDVKEEGGMTEKDIINKLKE